MRPLVIIVLPPSFDGRPRLGQAEEYMLVQAFVAQAAVKGFDECILHRLARGDVMPVESAKRPTQHRGAGELAAVITDYHLWYLALDRQTFQFAHDPHATNRGIDHTGQAFPAEVVDYAEDAKAAAVTERVRHEVERPTAGDAPPQEQRGTP